MERREGRDLVYKWPLPCSPRYFFPLLVVPCSSRCLCTPSQIQLIRGSCTRAQTFVSTTQECNRQPRGYLTARAPDTVRHVHLTQCGTCTRYSTARVPGTVRQHLTKQRSLDKLTCRTCPRIHRKLQTRKITGIWTETHYTSKRHCTASDTEQEQPEHVCISNQAKPTRNTMQY